MAEHLTLEESDRIAHLNSRGFAQAAIAKALGRSPSVISRELRRNRADDGTLKPGKRGSIPENAPPIPDRLNLTPELRLHAIEQLANRRTASRFNATASAAGMPTIVARRT